jgi:hypothetical protein
MERPLQEAKHEMSSGARSLRVLLVANDGFSAGHVVRALAVARGLASRPSCRRWCRAWSGWW